MYLKLYVITGLLCCFGTIEAQNDTDQYRNILGDWKGLDKLKVGGRAIKGFQLLLHADTFNTSVWNSEGVMYMSKNFSGSREFPSSFDYKILGDSLFMRITFSAAGYKVGDVFKFGYGLIKNQLILTRDGIRYRFKRID
ncbi:MAG: hypothetical protein ACON5K_11540 [Bacteroidia bacterium]